MLNQMNVKLNVIEGMHYFWQATSESEKVGEKYLVDLANLPEMEALYDEEFTRDSIRKVLSAISNREVLNSESKKERKFWNNNMWVMEDLELTNMMISPLKVLNLDKVKEELNRGIGSENYEDIDVVFVPGHFDEYRIEKNQLYINFFKVQADLYGENKLTIGEMSIEKYIEEKAEELILRTQ